MVTRVITKLIDDIDGNSEADETVRFALDGTDYEIELTKKNADKLRKALAPYIEAGRKARGQGKRTGRAKPTPQVNAAEVRAWAEQHGIDVPARGRLPKSVIEQYEAS